MKTLAVVLWLNVVAVTITQAQYTVWAKQFGGSSREHGRSVAVDATGNVYVMGWFPYQSDFDPGPATFFLTPVYAYDIFIVKLNANGNFVWAKQLGGWGNDYGRSVAVDAAGNVYACGSYEGPVDFDPGTGTFNLTSIGGEADIFITKLTANGNLVWAKGLKGPGDVFDVRSMAVDSSGNLCITGDFRDTIDFDPGADTFNLIPAGERDVFIAKFNTSGSLIWAKRLGGPGEELGNSVAFDAAGNVYAAGIFKNTVDFDPGPGTHNLTASTYQDGFVTRLDSQGNLVWAKQSPGWGNSVAVDVAGDVFVGGTFTNTVDFDPGPDVFSLTGAGTDVFVSKLDSSGNFVWAKQFGEAETDYNYSVVVDSSGNVYATGFFSTDSLLYEIFIVRINSSGSSEWIKLFGGLSFDEAFFLAIDDSGYLYLTGDFWGTPDYDPGPATVNISSMGADDAFVIKMNPLRTLSGTILTETGIPVPGASVTLSGVDSITMTTAADGRYGFIAPATAGCIITLTKNNDSIPSKGITSLDVLLMRRHTLGIAPLPSPYKVIAAAEANADGDTNVSTLDILRTRELILGNSTSFPTNRLWQFVSSDYVFPDASNPFPFDKTRTYTNITTNQTNQDFIGIKLGDVNGSWGQ